MEWTDIETKAAKARLLFWCRLRRTQSELMRRLEAQAHNPGLREQTKKRQSQDNWWRQTDSLVARFAEQAEPAADELRASPREAFRTVIGHVLWKEEYRRRFQVCEESARLTQIAKEMSRLAEEDSREGVRRTRWPGAPYLPFVDSNYHVRLLAMTRLGTLPVEIKTDR